MPEPLPTTTSLQGYSSTSIHCNGNGFCRSFQPEERTYTQANLGQWLRLLVCLPHHSSWIVMDLTTEAFMAAFGRFVARRGRLNTILSDNGTNFAGAHRVVDAAYHHLDLQDSDGSLKQLLADQRITWKHSPARSPHFGGIWEADVRQMKSLLYKHLGPTTKQMYTVLTEVEAILNSRPLMPMESSPTDGTQILTPAQEDP